MRRTTRAKNKLVKPQMEHDNKREISERDIDLMKAHIHIILKTYEIAEQYFVTPNAFAALAGFSKKNLELDAQADLDGSWKPFRWRTFSESVMNGLSNSLAELLKIILQLTRAINVYRVSIGLPQINFIEVAIELDKKEREGQKDD